MVVSEVRNAQIWDTTLLLVANRDSLKVGDFSFKRTDTYAFDGGAGNEFNYGGGQILTYQRAGNFSWGRQWIVDLIVRPIPRQLWPTTYKDAWDLLGIPDLFEGGPGLQFTSVFGWKGELGAAPGMFPISGGSFHRYIYPLLQGSAGSSGAYGGNRSLSGDLTFRCSGS